MKPIPNFENYKIDKYGNVYNSKFETIVENEFKNIRYVRLYKNGKRHTLSVNKLLLDLYGGIYRSIELEEGERVFRYKNTPYYITSHCRAYNSKSDKWLKVIYRNKYPTVNIYYNGRQVIVSIFKFLKSRGGVVGDR